MLLVPGLLEPASCARLVLTLKQEVVEMERMAPMQTQEGRTSSVLFCWGLDRQSRTPDCLPDSGALHITTTYDARFHYDAL